MDPRAAAKRWAETWQRCWETREAAPIAALYAEEARYSTEPFRDPFSGPAGALRYVQRAFAEEDSISARFGEPIVDGDRTAVQWWAHMLEGGAPITLAGTSVLRFDAEGLVIDEWDTWNQTDRRIDETPPGWGSSE